jgi:mRNA-degrading endonuclease toxin of MazEF toxin-antitoxin module
MKPGAIHWIETLAAPEPASEHEAVIIIQDDEAFLHVSATVLVVPLGPVPELLRGKPMVRIAPTAQNGLEQPAAAMIDQLHAVDRERLGDRLGEIDRATLIDIYRMLDRLIGRAPPPQLGTAGSGDTLHNKL